MADTIHIVFGEAGGSSFAMRCANWPATTVCSNSPYLSFGPIAPADPVRRAQWIADELGEPRWHEIVPHVEAFWAEALSGDARHVVWLSRRVSRDYCGFLNFLACIGNRACDVVDLTETRVPVRKGDGTITGSQRAICASFTQSYQFLEANLPSHAAPLSLEARAVHQAEWAKLRKENAALRLLTKDLRLSSAPVSYFDAAMLKEIRPEFLKAARVVGTLLIQQWDADIYNASDFCRRHRRQGRPPRDRL